MKHLGNRDIQAVFPGYAASEERFRGWMKGGSGGIGWLRAGVAAPSELFPGETRLKSRVRARGLHPSRPAQNACPHPALTRRLFSLCIDDLCANSQ